MFCAFPLHLCFLFDSPTVRSRFASEKNLLRSNVPLHCGMHTCTREHAHAQTKDQAGETLPYFSYSEILAEIIVPETENCELAKKSDHKNQRLQKLNKYMKQFVLAAEKCFHLSIFTLPCCKSSR